MNEKYMKIAYNESLKCLKSGDVPVGAVLVMNNIIIAKSHNMRVKKNNPLYHAEILSVIKASKKLKKYNLNDCELYVTLKPCSMCTAVINNAKIKKLYYLLDKPLNKKEYKTCYELLQTNVRDDYKEVLSDFFKKLRN